MAIQVRYYRPFGWDEWHDVELPYEAGFIYEHYSNFEIREKPEFEPGYFKSVSYRYGHGSKDPMIEWFDSQRAIDISAWTWRRVVVTDVD